MRQAIKSDGSILSVGDEVETTLHPKCAGVVFVVESIEHHPGYCASGYMVVVHVKGHPERKMLGFKKEGLSFIDGVSADWFTKIP
jgi:hypothetical protein